MKHTHFGVSAILGAAMRNKEFFSLAIAILSFFVLICPAIAKTYYVAPNGNDGHDGLAPSYASGSNGPLKTITKGAALLAAGDTLYLRSGTYQETVSMSRSGASGNRITIAGYPGETAVIDGNWSLPTSTWGALFQVTGSHVTVRDLEIKNSNWMGLVLSGAYSEAMNIYSHHNMEQGILLSGNYTIADRCRVYYNAMRNEYGRGYPNGGWGTGISAARGLVSYAAIRNCIIWNNWGEGLSTFESDHSTLEDNIVFDNQTNIYISDATNCLCQRNLVYSTPDNICSNSSGLQCGIMMGDEKYNPKSSNNTIINNLCIGNKLNFYWWPGNQGGGMVSATIANNTFVNSVYRAGIDIRSGSHSNSQFRNNIVVQEGSLPVASVGTKSGFIFSNNLWSKTAPTNVTGGGDVVGDPLISKTGRILPAELKPDYFKITAASPAVNSAVVLMNVKDDYFGSIRDNQPDIGAHEFSSVYSLSPSPPARLRTIQ